MSGSAREITLGDDFGEVVVKANGASVQIHADGRFDGIPASANDSLAQKILRVGDRLKDGTVCVAVDLKKNEALFAPDTIFGGKAKFDDQKRIPAMLNMQNYLGHDDWHNITDDEGKTLSEVWDKVAPDELKGRAAPWFWLASPFYYGYNGRARRGGEADWGYSDRDSSLPVPVVRSGPARG